MEKKLHIVCPDVPYPVDCKSAFIMFHELKALHAEGVKIQLHCFEYSRAGHEVLESFCENVHYYEKQKGHKGIAFSLPYIVSSRANDQLVENLKKDDDPILVHGIHCTYFLTQAFDPGRKIIVRLHYAEHTFYSNLAKLDKSLLKRIYFQNQSRILKHYEKGISAKAVFVALTGETKKNYKEVLGCKNVSCIPAVVPWPQIKSLEGTGTFCLFHGNLSMPENETAAVWLLEKVFNKLHVPLVIAGKDPSSSLEKQAHLMAHTCVVANPTETEMQDLIAKAHINVLPFFHGESCYIKLLNALFCGRHCVVTDRNGSYSELRTLLHVAGDPESFRSKVLQLMDIPFDREAIEARDRLLHRYYDNANTVAELMDLMWV